MFMIMYAMNVSSTANDQLSARRRVTREHANAIPMKATLILWTGVLLFCPFLNFMENIGISDTRSRESTTDTTGIKALEELHAVITLSGTMAT